MALPRTDILEQLKRAGRAAGDSFDIGETALCLAALDISDADFGYYRDHLHTLAADLRLAARGVKSLRDRLRSLRDVLYRFHSYAGDRETYDDPKNANLMHVIDRRKGLPVALGVLVIHCARSRAWAVSGVNFPGHFLLRFTFEGESVLVDPFEKLQRWDIDDLVASLARFSRGEPKPKVEHIRSVQDRDVLLRLQNNIKTRALSTKDIDRAIDVLETMRLIAPGQFELIQELTMLELEDDRVLAATGRLEAYLENNLSDRASAEALLRHIRNMLN
ncbi:MAG: transglutaminase-like domain-containing protein [Pseudomonadota bacterium]|nr:transglutaminase-like domain-containing protein [Pseudomonadota bacterium]